MLGYGCDYIVIDGGSAGGVMADRFREDRATRVTAKNVAAVVAMLPTGLSARAKSNFR